MAAKKRGRHAKKGGRTTPKGTRPLQLVHADRGPREPGMMEMVAAALRQPHPVDLVGLVSSMVWLASPSNLGRPPDLPTVDFLVDTWADVERRETTALLRAVAALGERAELRTAAAAASARRSHSLPAWVDGLGEARVTRVVEVGHVLGDGEVLLLEVEIPGSTGVTVDVYVDHNIGTFVKDAFVVPEPLDAVLHRMTDLLREPGTATTDVSLADARAKLTDALANPLSNGFLLDADDDRTWPRSRPAVEWILRGLPTGGTGYVRHTWTTAELRELVEAFFASPWGRALRDRDRRRLLERVVEVAAEEDDPMRWSPVRVEVLTAEGLVDDDDVPTEVLALAPDLLRAFIGYCHGERGVPDSLTDETMAAVDRWGPELQRAIDERDELYGDTDDPMWSWGAEMLVELVGATGSVAALRHLSVEPLPDEPFDWTAVAPDAVEAIEPVVALVDDVCERLFDLELRTAARRTIARLATADPSLFTRRSRLENTAAALVWVVATANDAFATHGLLVKDLAADLGISGTPSQRADTFLRALPGAHRGYGGVGLGSTELLSAAGRASVIARRDPRLEPPGPRGAARARGVGTRCTRGGPHPRPRPPLGDRRGAHPSSRPIVRRHTEPGAQGLHSHGWTPEQAEVFADACRAHGFVDVRVEEHHMDRHGVLAVLANAR